MDFSISPELQALNRSAPDEGNMHLIEAIATPAQNVNVFLRSI